MSANLCLEPETAEQEQPLPHRVLVVEDELDLQETLVLQLRSQGFEAVGVGSGKLAREKLTREKFDCLLLDICLPDASGLDLCREAVDDRGEQELPVIVISALDEPDLLRQCRAAGCRYFVSKPYDPNALLTLLEAALASDRWW